MSFTIGQAVYVPSTGTIGKVIAVDPGLERLTLVTVTSGEAFTRTYRGHEVEELREGELRNAVFPTWDQMAGLVHRMQRSHAREGEERATQVRNLRDQVIDLDARREAELTSYKVRVRGHVLDLAEQAELDPEATNEVLDALDLEPVETTWEVEVEVTAKQWVKVLVKAVNEDQAEARAIADEELHGPSPTAWELATRDRTGWEYEGYDTSGSRTRRV